MKRRIVLGMIVTVGVLSMTAVGAREGPQGSAQQAPKVAEIEKVKDNLYLLHGLDRGTRLNVTAFVNSTGVVVVDTGYPGWGLVWLDAIESLTNKPRVRGASYVRGSRKYAGEPGEGAMHGHWWVRQFPGRKQEVPAEYREFVAEFVAQVQAANKAGTTVDQALRGLRIPEEYRACDPKVTAATELRSDADCAYRMDQAKADAQIIYDELKK